MVHRWRQIAGLLLAFSLCTAQGKRVVLTFSEYSACSAWDAVQDEQQCATLSKCYGRRLVLETGNCSFDRGNLQAAEAWARATFPSGSTDRSHLVAVEWDAMLSAPGAKPLRSIDVSRRFAGTNSTPVTAAEETTVVGTLQYNYDSAMVQGSMSILVGATNDSVCAICPADTFSRPGQTSCTPCPEDTFSFAGAGECEPCAPSRSCKKLLRLYPPGTLQITFQNNTAATATLSRYAYANGNYTIEYSSTYSVNDRPLHAFTGINGANSAAWVADGYSSTGAYVSNVRSATLVSGFNGDWITMRMPARMHISSIEIYQRNGFTTRAPKNFRLYGRNGVGSWNSIINTTNAAYTNLIHTSTPPSSPLSNSYEQFGLVVNSLVGSSTFLNIDELLFYGVDALNCSKGFFYNTNTTSATYATCAPCAANTFNGATGMDACTPCAIGTFSAAGAAACTASPDVKQATLTDSTGLLEVGPVSNNVAVYWEIDTGAASVATKIRLFFSPCSVAYSFTKVAPGQQIPWTTLTSHVLVTSNTGYVAVRISTSTATTNRPIAFEWYACSSSQVYDDFSSACMDACPADGKCIRPYPPAPIGATEGAGDLSNQFSVSGQLYANGVYNVEWSSAHAEYPPSRVFNGIYPESGGGLWNGAYNSPVGTYSQTPAMSIVAAYTGDWIKLRLPVNVLLSHVKIRRMSNDCCRSRAPLEYNVYGSNDGTTWDLILNQAAAVYDSSSNIHTSDYAISTTLYSTFALVVKKLVASDSYATLLNFEELKFYGRSPNCSAGFYLDASAPGYCTECPTGTYSSMPGATSSLVCTSCPADTFAGPGQTSCSLCPDGTFSFDGAGECEPCAANSVCQQQVRLYPPGPLQITSQNSTAATATLSGYAYANGNYNIRYSSEGSASERPVHAFTGVNGLFTAAWIAGGYSATGAYATGVRAATLVSGFNGDWVTMRMPARVHISSIKIYQRALLPSRAPKSFRLYGRNGAGSWNSIITVAAATYTNLIHTATPLSSPHPNSYDEFGFAVNTLVGAETLLNFDELQLFGVQALTCAAGFFYDTNAASATHATCVACAGGSYTDEQGSYACTPCPTGTFTSTPGSLACTSCPADTFSGPGQASCSPCPEGTFSFDGAGECSVCTPNSVCQQQVRLFPPAAFGGAAASDSLNRVVTGFTYGNGNYVIANSSFLSTGPPSRVFNGFPASTISSGVWSAGKYGNNPAGKYLGSASLVSGYLGEWITLRMPTRMHLSLVTIHRRELWAVRSPKHFRVYGRNAGGSWVQLIDVGGTGAVYSGIDNTYSTAPVSIISPSYNEYGLVVNNITGYDTNGYLNFEELQLYGSEALICDAGLFYNTNVSSATYATCAACASGSYSTQGSYNCTPCPAGTFTNTPGTAVCTSCPADTFSVTGSALCTQCPQGTFSLTGAEECAACTPNSLCQQQVRLFPPAAFGGAAASDSLNRVVTGFTYGNGNYVIANSSFLNTGPPSRVFNGFPASTSSHGAWVNGRYIINSSPGNHSGTANLIPGYTGEWTTLKMPTRIHISRITIYQRSLYASRAPMNFRLYGRNTGGSWTQLIDVVGTSAMYTGAEYTATPNPLSPLPFNEFGLVVNKILGPDSSGILNFEELQLYGSEALTCNAGFFYNADAASATYATCVACAAGSYSFQGSYNCTPCPAGTSSAVSSSACTACREATYAAASGSSACTQCPQGTLADAGASQCTNCTSGDCRGIVLVFPPAAVAGTDSTDFNTSRTLTGLAYGNGNYSIAYSSIFSATSLPPQRVFDGVRDTSSSGAWNRTRYDATNGVSLSTASLVPGYSGEWITISLPVSFHLSHISIHQRASFLLGTPRDFRLYGRKTGGSWAEVLRITGTSTMYTQNIYTAPSVSPTPPSYNEYGLVVNRLLGATNFLNFEELQLFGTLEPKCDEGYYYDRNTSLSGSAACTPCAAGSYSNVTGAHACVPCPAGLYASNPGSSSCRACVPGTYSLAQGSASCLPCRAGQFNAGLGTSSCTNCLPGFFS